MSSFFGLAEQMLSSATSGSSESESTVRQTGGQEYNTPHHSQQPQGGFNTQEVLSHAEADNDEDQGYIANAIQHVHDNSHQAHNEQLQESDLSKYGPMILSAVSSVSSKSGLDVGTLMSGGLGSGGGNQLMGLVMKHASSAFAGGGGEEKQSMMNGAAMTLAKVVAQKQLSAFTGGSNSGGLGMLGGVGETLLKSRFG